MNEMVLAEKLVFEYQVYDEDGNVKGMNKALKDLTISVARGQFAAILGHNGSGKSTFAKLLNAVLTPKEGCLVIAGYDAYLPENLWEIRKNAGMVFQNPENQMIAAVVEEDIAFGPENLGIDPKEIRRRVDDSLRAVQMLEYKKHSPHMLSGGQKQRISIAGILAMHPQCIIFDEPTAMLDPSGRREVMEMIKKLHNEGITVILITHYMEEAVLADLVYVMQNGEVVLQGTPQEIFSQVPAMKELGLGAPQVTELAYELKQEGVQIDTDVLTEEDLVEKLCSLKLEI